MFKLNNIIIRGVLNTTAVDNLTYYYIVIKKYIISMCIKIKNTECAIHVRDLLVCDFFAWLYYYYHYIKFYDTRIVCVYAAT